jgi:biopolymer transport protein ExbD
MPKINIKHQSPHIDMTPMVDLFSLLLTFFMLTATFRPDEPAPVDTPYSVSEKKTPDNNIMTVTISADKRVFFNVDNGQDTILHYRPQILKAMGSRYNIEFSPEELRKFEKGNYTLGVSMQDMKTFLNARDANERTALEKGIPIDSTDNQLAMWVLYTRQVNPNVQTLIKGDGKVEYPIVKKVLDVLQLYNVKVFNLITNLEKVQVTQKVE